MLTACFVAAAVLGVLRAFGFRSQAYQAFAHLYVGGVFAAWLCGQGPGYLALFVILTVLEVVCFLVLPKADVVFTPSEKAMAYEAGFVAGRKLERESFER